MLTDYSSLIGGDFGIYQTVGRIKGIVLQSLTDPASRIRLRAESLLSASAERDSLGEIESIFYWVQNRLHYVNDPVDIELLKNPILIDDSITQTGYFMGDCDDVSGYLAALLKSVGYHVNLVIVSPEQAAGFSYRHIYVRVYVPKNGCWLGLDATAKGKPIGWEVPNKKEREYPV